MQEEVLDFYRKQSEISNPGKFASRFNSLPDSVDELCKVVQNTFSHIFWIREKNNYGFTPFDVEAKGRDPSKELNLRSLEEKLEALFSYDDTPLGEARDNINRVVGNCRDFALLLVSILRHKGIPARVRSGAARYFFPLEMERYEDHYICEYWNEEEKRWIMVDPQIDDLQKKTLNMKISPLDLPYDQFLDAGRTWQVFREGEINPEKFGIGDWRGEMFALNKLIMELACLNKVEVLAWESWGICSEVKNIKSLGYEVFDEIAEKISKVNQPEIFQELRNLFETDPRYMIPKDYEPWFLNFKK